MENNHGPVMEKAKTMGWPIRPIASVVMLCHRMKTAIRVLSEPIGHKILNCNLQ